MRALNELERTIVTALSPSALCRLTHTLLRITKKRPVSPHIALRIVDDFLEEAEYATDHNEHTVADV